MRDTQATLDLIQKATGMTYSEEQKALISSTGGACVLACAGSGKTTAMTHLIARRLLDKDIKTGRRILGVTFSKTGANEMDERLEALLELLEINTTVKMKTLHAFCLEFLKTIGVMRGRAVLSEYDKLNILQEIGRKQAKSSWNYDDAEAIAGLITLQRGGMRNRSEFLTSVDFRSTEMEQVKFVTVSDEFKKYKSANNVIDFDDMLMLAHYQLLDSFYRRDFMDKYECIMVDEAQDMSVLQYRIVYQLLGKDYKIYKEGDQRDNLITEREHDEHVRDTLVLIGDDDQCIYEWMGSKPQGLYEAYNAYRLPLYKLSTNYRCPSNILSAAARCISNNLHSVEKAMDAYKEGGTLRFERVNGGFHKESEYIATKIKEELDAGVAPNSIAVLARNGAHLSLIWLYLSCYGIKSRMYGGQSSGPDSLIRHISSCFKMYTSMADASNVFYALFGGSKRSHEKLSTLVNMVDGTFQEWMEYVLCEFMPMLNIKASPDNSYMNSGKSWKEAMRSAYYDGSLSNGNTMSHIQTLYTAICKSPREFYLAILKIYRSSMEWKYKADDSIRVYKGTLDALIDLITKTPETALPVLDAMDKYKAPNKNYVTLSTAHSAKGREWSTVYMLCDDLFAFPSQISLDMLSKSGDARAVNKFIEGERRLHYVAMTRAKNTLHIVGGDAVPGQFLREALVGGSVVDKDLLFGGVTTLREERDYSRDSYYSNSHDYSNSGFWDDI